MKAAFAWPGSGLLLVGVLLSTLVAFGQTPALVQSNSAQGTSVSSLPVSFSSSNTAGNLIVASVRIATTTQTVTIADTVGNTYTSAVSQAQSTDGHQVFIFYAKNIKAGSNTVTASFSASNAHAWLAVYEYSGLGTTTALDATAHASGSSTAPSSGSTSTTTVANELVFGACGLPYNYSGTVTAGSGYTLLQQNTTTSRAANEGRSVSATGAYAGTFSLSATANWSAAVTTFATAPAVTTSSLAAGTQGAAYSATLAAGGGKTSYTWSVTVGTLPAGLSLNASSGAITGTPTAAGTSNITVQVKDANNNTGTKALSITINPSVAITTTSLPSGTQNAAYSSSLTAAGGTTPYTWSLTVGTLPTGLSLNTSSGAITGTPTATGTSNITVQAKDANNATATKALSITINAPPSITTASLPAGTQNVSYSATLAATSGTTPYTWSITVGTLPAGLSLNTSTGAITGTPTASGTSNITVQVKDANNSAATKALSITINAPLSITTASLPGGTQNAAYSTTLAATGGATPYTWSITVGTLPTGLSLNASTGAITGTPTATGPSNITVQVKDANNITATKALSITINAPPSVTTTSLPGGTQNTSYSATLAATGGTTPYTWSVTVGTLPAGLSLNASTGAITGTPTATGTSNITVQAKDANNATATKALSITINAPPSITTASLPAGTQNASYSATLAATSGTTPYTWSITVGALPAGLSLNTNTGAITGTPTASGTSNITVQVKDANNSAATKALSITINAPLSITTTSLPAGTQNVAYSATLAASGGTTPYTWSVTVGTLPNGLSLNGSSGAITGTPTATGTSNVTVQVKDTNNSTATKALSITINAPLSIATTSLPGGTPTDTYGATLAATGGATPYTWSVTAGTLPAGLSLTASSGAITGTPTTTGTSNITVQVKDANNNTATQPLSITIGGPDFSLDAIPMSLQVAQGGTASFTVTATPLDNFSQSIALSVSGLPAGATASFTPTTIPGSGGATLNIPVSTGTAPGSYPFTVTGVSGSLSHQIGITLTVVAPAYYEAEAAANQLAGGAVVTACAPCSGGYRVDNIGYNGPSSYGTLTFPTINAPTAGIYTLTVYYTNGDVTTRTANISVNGNTSSLSISATATGSWTTVNAVSVNVTLAAGSNTIAFSNGTAPAPSIDRISLVNTESCSAAPVDVVLVIDTSSSMGGLPIESIQSASEAFVSDLQLTSDQIALVSFTSTATTDQTLTHTGSLVQSAIAALTSGGNTAIATGINAAVTELTSARHNPAAQQVIVLLSDGNDSPASGATATTNAANAAKAAGIRLITIAYGAANAAMMQSWASSSSDYYASPTPDQMTAVYGSISASICRSPNQAPVVDAGPDQAVVLPAAAALLGTMSDDGLPQGNSLTAAWLMVSGPGTVTFANPNAAATTATFSAAGTYVLQLSASDGQLTSTDTVTVTVSAPVISVSIAPTAASLFGGQTQLFTATVTGTSNQNVTWSVDVGTFDANGTYHAPTTIASQQVATVTAASQADPTKHAAAPVTLLPPVTVSPASVILYAGGTQRFVSNQAVTWSISPTGMGTFDPGTGLYTAPASITAQRTLTVTAASTVASNQSASANIYLEPSVCTTSGYVYQRTIVIDHTKVPNTDQTNFPLLVSLSDPFLATASNGGHVANASGYDIIFASDAAGANKLDHEIESYNPSTGQIVMWVRIPTLSHTANTSIYLLYGNPAITTSQENRPGVWDSNFGGVWHLAANGAAVSTLDSTSHGNNGTVVGAATAVGAQIGSGAALGGYSNYIDAGNSPSVSPTHTGTLSVWVKYNAFSSWTTPIGNGNTYTDRNGVVFWDDGSGLLALEVNSPTTYNRVYDPQYLTTGQWYFLAGTWDGSTVSLYQNGAPAGSTAQTIDASPAYHLTLGVDGALSSSGDFLNGVLDEARVSNIARSADWIATEYNNQASPATFYSVSAENTSANTQAISVSPASATVYQSQTRQFSATVFGACTGITWNLSSPNGSGSVDSAGLYTAPASILTQQGLTLTAAIQGGGPTSAGVPITLMPPVAVTPATATLMIFGTVQFSANQPVTLSISPTGIGTFDPATGWYVAPAAITAPLTLTVTATSTADFSQFTSVPIYLVPSPCTTSAYGYQRAIVIDHTKVPNTDQTNFPLLVSLTDPSLATTSHGGHVASANGYDISFASDAAGANKLDHEIESYDPSTGQIVMWVRVPSLSHTTNTTIYLLYGNPAITTSQENRPGVWDSNFGGVWHLAANGAAVSTLDSTSHANNGTVVGAATAVGAQIGSGAALVGYPNYIDAGNDPSVLPTHTGTLSVWVKYNTYSSYTTPMGNGNTQYSTNGAFFWDDSYGLLNFEVDGSGAHNTASAGYVLSKGPWYHLAGTWDGSTVKVYKNGAIAGSTAQTIDASPAYHLALGADGALSNTGNFLNGVLDEARVSNIARSADWIATEYNNQVSPATFYAVSAENMHAITVSPANVALFPSQTQQFTSGVLGGCQSLNWHLDPAMGNITDTGLYSAPNSIPTEQSVALTVTVSGSGTATQANIDLRPFVNVTPASATLTAAQSVTFSANQSVTWSVTPAGVGTMTSAGQNQLLYTAPVSIGVAGVTVTATSTASPGQFMSVPVTFSTAVPILHVTPQTAATYQPGQTVVLAIGVQNAGTADASATTIGVVNPDSSVITLTPFSLPSGQSSSQQASYTIPTLPPPPAPKPIPLNTGASLFGVNLIVNGNAEAALGADSDNIAVSVPGWNRTGNFTTIVWQSPGQPVDTTPGPVNRGSNMFAGGPNNGSSSASQDIDVSSAGGMIDGGAVQYDFSAYLGGFYTQSDNAILTAQFKNATGATLSTATLGPVTEQDRNGVTALLPRSTSGLLPAGTRTVTVTMLMTRTDGQYNDGYADNLALVLTAPSSTGGADPDSMAYLDALRAADDRSLPFAVQTSWKDPGGRNYGPTTTQAQTTEILPIVTVALSATPDTISGKTIAYTATIANTGHAAASSIAVSITLPDGTVQALSLPSTTLAPQATMQATASFTVGLSQPSATLFARAAVTWADSTANSYGPLLSTASTNVVQFAFLLQNATFTAAPAAPGPYITGTSQTFTVTLIDQTGAPVSGTVVTFTVSGANTASGTATTDANGRAAFTYTGANNGSDNVQASINLGAGLLTSNGILVTWVTPVAPLSTTPLTGTFYSGSGSGVFSATSSTAVAFTQAFPTLGFNAPTGTVLNNTSGTAGATGSFTDVATDIAGNYSGVLPTQAGTGTLASFQAAFQGSLLVKTAGSITFTVYADNGFVFGIGNGAVAVSGPNVNPPASGATALSALPVMGVYNQAGVPGGALTVTVNFPLPGNYPYEIDYAATGTGSPVLTLASSASSNRIVPSAGALLLTPLAPLPQSPGGTEVVTVNVTDVMGQPVANKTVALTVTGANPNVLSTHYNTDANGNVTYSYVGANAGLDTLQAATTLGVTPVFSNIVTVQWGGQQPPGGPVISITSAGSVTLPNSLLLTGTVSGLAPGNTFTAAWQQVNGPGTATFASPTQATTQVSFSVAGTYVLQLSATSNGLVSTSQVTVIVNPQPDQEPGWIGGPAYGGLISGVVPIVLASGVTLQSGTLSYYPASNTGAAVVLNATTTGSGQIGTLDTTQLRNGEYWIELVATDSTGHTQTNLALVTVVGDYKPGRVTATVTDLVVPARGLAIKIERSYDSLNKDRIGDFGYGWSLGVRVDLEIGPTGDVTFTLGGKRRTFSFTPQYVFPPVIAQLPLFLPAYTPEPGLHGSLVASGPGCMLGPYSFWDVLVQYGSTFLCDTGGVYSPAGYVYTDPFGTQYTMGADGTLQSIKDLSGNTLTVTSAGITSSTGLSVPFWRDGNGRITWIEDTAGNWYQYIYDANGNLATVAYPPPVPNATAPQTTYTYYTDPAHLYQGGTDPRGNPLPTATYDDSGRLQSVTTAPNPTTTYTTSYTYDLTNNITTTTFPDTGVQTVQYDSYGMVLSTTDPLQHTTTNVYDANHNLISTTDPLNHTTTYTYDANGNQLSKTYPKTATSVNTTSYTVYNQYSEPTGTHDELGNVRAFAYDANFLPSSVIDNLNGTPTVRASFTFNPDGTMQAGAIGYDITVSPGMATQYTYDAFGNMLSKTDALGRQTSWTYDALGRKITQTDPTTAVTTFTYDALGNLTQIAAPLGRTTSSQYDGNNNKISDTDPNGNTTTYQYDPLNRLSTTTYPTVPPTSASLTYDFRGNVTNATDPAGNVTHNDYDLAGRLVATTKAYGTGNASRTTYTYYADGTKQTQTDPRGNATTYTYDAAARLILVTGAANNNTQYAYDDAGNQISVTDANNHTTQFQYDCRKRLVKTTYNDSTYTTNAYDGPGNPIGVTDQAGNTVQYTYDAANQLSSVIQANAPDPAHNTTAYTHDNNGNPITSTDANAHTTQTPFDVLNELTSTTLPDGSSTESRAYDYAGNLLSLLNFNGKTTAYGYDPLNRLLSKTPDPTLGEPIESFTYTATGKRATMTDASGTTTYAYDSLDHLISKATPQGTLSYTYDAAGNVASMTSSNANGISAAYTYDQINRLAAVVDNRLPANQNTTGYTYDPASNLATATYPNGQQSTFAYDTLNRLTGLNGYSYQLGATGNRQSAREPSGRTANWSYDGIYRLTNEAINSDPHGVNGAAAYGLDPVGNRLSEASTLPGIQSGNWTYNPDDQLSTEQYDANGNTIVSGARAFAYDFQNRLKSVNNGAVTILYDGDGNRVAKTVGGATTQYLVDDLNPTGYAQVVEELANSTVTRRYTLGLQRISQTQFLNGVWTTSFYGYDGFGSVRQLTEPTGAVTDTYDYDAWGNAVNVTGSTPNVYRYRGERYDPDLGLYYLRARYYNPFTGRFLSRDLLNGQLSHPKSLHSYLYAEADPVNGMDPSGNADIIEFTLLLKTSPPVPFPHWYCRWVHDWFGCPALPAPTPTPTPKPTPRPKKWCQAIPTNGSESPNACYAEYGHERPYVGPSMKCEGDTDCCLDLADKFMAACRQQGLNGAYYHTGFGGVGAACCAKH